MVQEHREAHGSQWSAIQSIAAKIGCSGETLRNWWGSVPLSCSRQETNSKPRSDVIERRAAAGRGRRCGTTTAREPLSKIPQESGRLAVQARRVGSTDDGTACYRRAVPRGVGIV